MRQQLDACAAPSASCGSKSTRPCGKLKKGVRGNGQIKPVAIFANRRRKQQIKKRLRQQSKQKRKNSACAMSSLGSRLSSLGAAVLLTAGAASAADVHVE